MAKEYNASSMKHFEGVEAIQKRPGMYVGVGESAIQHLVYEVITNSVDEHMMGHGKKIEVEILEDNHIKIKDEGRGIPFGNTKYRDKEIPACVLAATVTHAGGKFDAESYKNSAGLNGVGLTAVNALSEFFKLTTYREGKIHSYECKHGKVTVPLKKTGKSDKTGTVVEFIPHAKYLDVKSVKFDPVVIKEMCRRFAYLNDGLEMTVTYKGKTVSYKYKDGLAEYVQDIIDENKMKAVFKSPIRVKGEYVKKDEHTGKDKTYNVNIVFNYTLSDGEIFESFVNGLRTASGGTHVTGFKLALATIMAKQVSMTQEKSRSPIEVEAVDIRDGIVAVVSIKLQDPLFKSQTKDELGNKEAQGATQKLTNDVLNEMITKKHPAIATMCNRAINAAKGRIAAKKAREVTRKDFTTGSMSLPAKLKDCRSNDPNECELFILEGQSAGGSAVDGRDSATQAILCLKGKILNTFDKSINSILENQEVQDIISAIGCGIGERFDLSKIRYKKICILTDADTDGSHIAVLLLTLFYTHMKPLIEKGHIYIAHSPLYVVKKGSKKIAYLLDEKQRKEWTAKYDKKHGENAHMDLKFNYIKGLGELDAAMLAETTLDKGNRILTKVTLKDAKKADKSFDILMNSNAVGPRQQFITENAQYASTEAE